MSESMVGYFLAEKHESALFIGVGLAAMGLSVWLWRTPHRGMIYPLVAIAVIQLAVGSSVYARTDSQIASLSAQFAQSANLFRTSELARMDTVRTGSLGCRWPRV